MKNYINKVTERIEKFEKEQKPNTKAKPTNNLFKDFVNLFQLRGIELVCQSHSETVKAYRAKIEQLKLDTQKLADERRTIIKEEQRKFKEAKEKGIKALIDYKLSKAKFRNKLTKAEQLMKNDYQTYRNKMEEQLAYERYVNATKNENVGTGGYMYVSRLGTQEANIIAAGVNQQVATKEIDKLTKMQNITNSMLAYLQEAKIKGSLNPRFDELADQFDEIDRKLQHKIGTNVGSLRVFHMDKSDTSYNKSQIHTYENEIRVAQSYIRVAMKQAKYIKSDASKKLYSA
jgi:hypothetical protein